MKKTWAKKYREAISHRFILWGNFPELFLKEKEHLENFFTILIQSK